MVVHWKESHAGREESRAEHERAASLTKNDRERALLLKRAAATRN